MFYPEIRLDAFDRELQKRAWSYPRSIEEHDLHSLCQLVNLLQGFA